VSPLRGADEAARSPALVRGASAEAGEPPPGGGGGDGSDEQGEDGGVDHGSAGSTRPRRPPAPAGRDWTHNRCRRDQAGAASRVSQAAPQRRSPTCVSGSLTWLSASDYGAQATICV